MLLRAKRATPVSVHARRSLGRSPLVVSAVGLGCWQFSGGRGLAGSFWAPLDRDRVRAVIEASLEAGVDWFDTAEAYGSGTSERVLAGCLSELKVEASRVTIATKWNPTLRTSPSIRDTFARRQECLRPFPIGLHQIHHPYGLSPVEAEMRVMVDLLDRERISAIGVSNFSAPQMRRAHRALLDRGHALTSNQVKMSLLDRSVERNGVLEVARELGVTLIAYSPLEQGLLSGRFHDDPELVRRRGGLRRFLPAFGPKNLERTRPLVDALRDVGERHEATSSQIALAWLLQFYGDRVVVIPGASSAEQARANAGAMRIVLSVDELDRLDRASKDVT